MRIKLIGQIGVAGLLGLVWTLGVDCCLQCDVAQTLSASEMQATAVVGVNCVDKIPQTNCTSEFSNCIATAKGDACAILGCTKCTTDAAYSDCNSSGTNYQTCTVTVTGGGCGTASVASCSVQSNVCQCGTYTGTTTTCAQKTVTATTKCTK